MGRAAGSRPTEPGRDEEGVRKHRGGAGAEGEERPQ